MRILIAEDKPVIAKLYKMVLEKRNHKVTVTGDGEICVKEYKNSLERLEPETNKKTPFDVVVLDIKMPNKDGIQTAKEILELNPSQRILFSSAYVKEFLVDKIEYFNEIIGVLEKPIELSILADIIEDKDAYEKLERLKIRIQQLDDIDPSKPEIIDMIDSATKNQKPDVWYSVGNLIVG